jgi:hypothetical protein
MQRTGASLIDDERGGDIAECKIEALQLAAHVLCHRGSGFWLPRPCNVIQRETLAMLSSSALRSLPDPS